MTPPLHPHKGTGAGSPPDIQYLQNFHGLGAITFFDSYLQPPFYE